MTRFGGEADVRWYVVPANRWRKALMEAGPREGALLVARPGTRTGAADPPRDARPKRA